MLGRAGREGHRYPLRANAEDLCAPCRGSMHLSQDAGLSDDQLKGLAGELRQQLENGGTDDILPQTFAMVREVAVRTMGMRHYDVQILGGIVLHRGIVAGPRPVRARRCPQRCQLFSTDCPVRASMWLQSMTIWRAGCGLDESHLQLFGNECR